MSIWLDDLSRDLLDTGHLAALVADKHVVGVTSNPSIIARAIRSSDLYDRQIRELAAAGMDAERIVLELMTSDVRDACDLLAPVARTTQYDGRVSVEVQPELADDPVATVASAKRMWCAVDRANVMIKIPATMDALPAIIEVVAAGISVNVTLIFSVERYRAVMDAYLCGLERAANDGLELASIHSVGSFFVSRVDSEVDKRLGAHVADAPRDVRGQVGIANAVAAYAAFADVFSSDRWKALESIGANVQRPLWASTGVKNPALADTRYVADLVAPGTGNTMPEATLQAFADHGVVNRHVVTGRGAQAQAVLVEAARLGVDMLDVAHVLEREAVSLFRQSWSDLVANISATVEQWDTSTGAVEHGALASSRHGRVEQA